MIAHAASPRKVAALHLDGEFDADGKALFGDPRGQIEEIKQRLSGILVAAAEFLAAIAEGFHVAGFYHWKKRNRLAPKRIHQRR